MLEDYLRPETVEDFKRDFRGIVHEVRCTGCPAVLPLIFEEGTHEYETLIGQGGVIEVEVQCHECRTLASVTTGSETTAWDSRIEGSSSPTSG